LDFERFDGMEERVDMDSMVFLALEIIIFVISFYSLFKTEKFVDFLLSSKREYFKRQGWSSEKIENWINERKSEKWYLFYKLLGVFGLIITSISLIITLRKIYSSVRG
jgi:hypothetical protein